MKKIFIFLLGLLSGTILVLLFCRNGVSSNNGSEFWGDVFVELIKGSGKGVASNNGSRFYSDLYIKEKFKSENERSE